MNQEIHHSNIFRTSMPLPLQTSRVFHWLCILQNRLLAVRVLAEYTAVALSGTIQAFVPEKKLEAFKAEMERVFGEGSCYVLSIRPVGGVQIDL